MNEIVGESVDAGAGGSVGGSAGDALRNYVHAELEAAITRLGWRGGRLHAGVHQARKSLRRARATLALGAAALGPGAALLDRELRRINTGLCALRDAQALVETLDRQLAIDHDAATQRLLRRARRIAASARVVAARAALAGDPGLGQRIAMLRVLASALAALPWAGLAAAPLHAAFAASQAKVEQAQHRALASGHDEDWHRWRRRARRLSQQRRALTMSGLDAGLQRAGSAGEKPALGKHTAELLGGAQDLSLLLDHCGRGSAFSKPDRAALRAFAKPELARLRERIARAAQRS